MKRSSWISMFLVVAACSDPKPMTTGVNLGETEEGGETTEGATDSGGQEETGVVPVTSGQSVTTEPDGEDTGIGEVSSGGGEDSGPCNFICPEDMDGGGECDQWAQDCPDGEKCSAYADNGGSSWNNTKCVTVVEDADVPGDPCTVEGNGVSGLDSCIKGSMCWDVDPNTNEGSCVDLCDGTPDAPVCESGFACAIANTVLNLCLPTCDPLAQDCPNANLCIPSDDSFLCVLDASGEEGQAFDPCEYGNACDQGLYCLDPAFGSECDPAAGGCCLPFCDQKAADCPGVGQVCLAWYDEGTAPPGYEDVGICGLMM